jgi:CheY-like chemotaxis protein
MVRNILVTGDYWNPDFKSFLTGFDAVTLVPIQKIATTEQSFDLVVIAQSEPGQFQLEVIEQLQMQFANTPLVAVMGSWCEGEQRTGQPWPGVPRIYWHQWKGRFESFIQQLKAEGITGWHAPRTSSVADRIFSTPKPHLDLSRQIKSVGISAPSDEQFEMLRDVMQHFGWECHWVERCPAKPQSDQRFDVICVEADSLSKQLEARIGQLESEFPHAGLVVVLGFPRTEDVQRLLMLGVSQVVSKPFELSDLRIALNDSLKDNTEKNRSRMSENQSNSP